ncbi:MAG: hypothetical protein ACR2HG_09885 [Pyrinomonadaceae bacterium]
MKRKNVHILIVTILLFASLLTAIFASNNLEQSKKVAFTVKSDKNNISLGEIVSLEFEFVNEGESAVRIPSGGVMAGNTEIFIAKKGESYRRYFRSDWGRKNEKVITLASNQKHKIDDTNATILWNGKPDYSHLNSDAAKRADKQDNRILTDYAFPDAGTYLVKATSCLIDELKGCSVPIESKPIEIKVSEPVGEDLEVWNQIKGNRGLAMLMQKGEFDTGKEAEKQQLTNGVEQILEKYPNSIYSSYLKPNLEKYKTNEARRNDFYKNVKQKPE